MVSAIEDLATAQPASTGATSSKALTGGDSQDRFLKLLVTQLKNQDPLNPMDNAQVTTQLAQISTVAGIDKLNDTLKSLSSSFLAGQSVQASTMIGRDVLATGANLVLDTTGADGGVELRDPADQVTARIVTAAGALVRTVDLGAHPAGAVGFHWDGTTDAGGVAPAGTYRLEVSAVRDGRPVTATALTTGRVAGVSLAAGEIRIEIDGVGTVGFGEVRQIR